MTQSNNRNFFIRRFHSLIALIPIGIFLLVHLFINSSVFAGLDNYEFFISIMESEHIHNYVLLAEIVIIGLPLLFHGIYGFYIVYKAKNNVTQYKYYRNWAFYLQRITAVIIALFLIWHVAVMRFIAPRDPAGMMDYMVQVLQNPVNFILYIIGVAAAIYHFANGLFTFCLTWGISQGEKAQKIFSACAVLLFVVLTIAAVAILFAIRLSA